MPAALAAASSASLSLLRRANASTGVSPARIREVAIFNGVFPGDSTFGETTAGAHTPEAVGGGVGAGGGRIAGAFKSGTTMFGCHRGLRRLAGLCPSSRLIQSRRASSDTRTSRPRSPLASASTEAPSRRNRSSSSRCGASANAIVLRGQRACATNSAKVGGTVGASSCGDCGVVGVMWEQYSDRCGSAMGAVWVRSKPTGLDVGVLTYAFLLFFVNSFSSWKLLLRLSLWILQLVEVFRVRFDEWVQSLRFSRFVFFHFDEWVDVVIRGLNCSISCSLSSLGWSGGLSC